MNRFLFPASHPPISILPRKIIYLVDLSEICDAFAVGGLTPTPKEFISNV